MANHPTASAADLACAARTYVIPISADARLLYVADRGDVAEVWTFPSAIRRLPRVRAHVVARRVLDRFAVEYCDLRLVGIVAATAEHGPAAVYTAVIVQGADADDCGPGVRAITAEDGIAAIGRLRPTGLGDCLRTAISTTQTPRGPASIHGGEAA